MLLNFARPKSPLPSSAVSSALSHEFSSDSVLFGSQLTSTAGITGLRLSALPMSNSSSTLPYSSLSSLSFCCIGFENTGYEGKENISRKAKHSFVRLLPVSISCQFVSMVCQFFFLIKYFFDTILTKMIAETSFINLRRFEAK